MGPSESALVNVSSWADKVADDPAYAWSRDLHFSSTPYRACSAYNETRDCGNGSGRCIVTAIANYTQRAADYGLPLDERAEALKFLIHFVADAHSGVHIGFSEDVGGNLIYLADPQISLHEVWDSLLLDTFKDLRGLTSWGRVSSELVGLITGSPDLCTGARLDVTQLENAGSVIATETAITVTCTSAYTNDGKWLKSGHTLGEEYLVDRAGVSIDRLIKAGVRLAQVLDAVATSFYSQERAAELASVSDQTPSMPSNRFSPLDYDFDPEEAVFEMIVDELVATEEDAEEPPTHVPAATTTPSADEKRASKNKAKRLREASKKRSIDGVNVERLVLIKRRGVFYITYRHLVQSDGWTPSPLIPVSVHFANKANPDIYYFDGVVFGHAIPLSRALLEATFRILNGETLILPSDSTAAANEHHSASTADDTAAPEGTFEAIKDYVRPQKTHQELQRLYRGKIPSVAAQQIDVLHTEAGGLVEISLDSLILIVRARDIMNASRIRWVFNAIALVDPHDALSSKTMQLYVDANVIDGSLAPEALQVLFQITRRPLNRALSRHIAAQRPPLMQRMSVLSAFIESEHQLLEAGLYCRVLFSQMTPIARPDMQFYQTIEFVMSDEMQIARALQGYGLPQFERFLELLNIHRKGNAR